ncbi:PREDICTED: taste receptor type 2 member 1-like [Cyprinodon variegatus]|nr:PREDICTED: taste receptor type 2 member 1-like [Cyprinodon variegatus]
MNYLTWTLINVPLGVINFTCNGFYIFCVVCPLQGERIKQPLKLLLSSLIVSTDIYLLTVLGLFFSEEIKENNIAQICLVISLGCLSVSVSSFAWLNFFYYTQIVPGQRALFTWIKKNIKPIIYSVVLLENICNLLDFSLMFLVLNNTELNMTTTGTHASLFIPPEDFLHQPLHIYIIRIFLLKSRFYTSFIVMMTSSGITVVYLGRHIRRMVINGQSLSSAVLSSQLRVTITGILQCLLYFFFALWWENASASQHNLSALIDPHIRSTVVSFYMLGVTFNLGAGQSVFRQRAADMWSRAGQCCKRLEPKTRSNGVNPI